MLLQTVLVVRPDGTDVDRAAVAEEGIGLIALELKRHGRKAPPADQPCRISISKSPTPIAVPPTSGRVARAGASLDAGFAASTKKAARFAPGPSAAARANGADAVFPTGFRAVG